ncbi:hypothetical protein Lal_00047383 [Lupinus albus]|nr:hypothetical protein Lal_00047383 [Lupinus albus]
MQGELENALETQEPNLFMEPGLNQFRNVDHQEQNYAGISKVSMAAAQGNGNSLGSSSYHVPVMEPNSQNQLVSGTGAPSQSSPATQHANNNTNLQPQKSQVSTDRGKKVAKDKEKAKFQGLLSQYYPLAMPLNPQNQFQSTERQGLLGTNPTRKQLRIGESSSSSSSSRNVRMRTPLLDNNQQSTPIRVGNNPSTMHGNHQHLSSIQMENPPAPLVNNNQHLPSVQVGNLHNPFAFPDNGKQMTLHGDDSFNINQPTLRNNGQQVAPTQMENPPTHLLNNNQQMVSDHFGNSLNPSPMLDNGQQLPLPWVDNSPSVPNNNQQLAPIPVDNLHNQPAQGSENPPPPTRYLENGLYGQVYEQMGYYADPILRLFLSPKQKRG